MTLTVVALCLLTTFWGADDHFPFTPFKMYSFSQDLDGWADSTRLEYINTEGEHFGVNDQTTGFRRAELEGQLGRFREDPELLAHLAEAYENAHPDRPEIVGVEIYIRWYEIKDGYQTGAEEKVLEVAWYEEGYQP
ncbi:hypothetical protein [Glycomyces buryatensis]|uniref:Uncharacterized protein n=1 Tax=Glycomyces buryatensis TaxID=2570927 RepID=A0A4S8Q353_9ACTN|nr:hypothetical protein [Glycomyces buryatensis]THV38538.1 hypothetical protein FAB82_19025 [Glycomyces buryatensis]